MSKIKVQSGQRWRHETNGDFVVAALIAGKSPIRLIDGRVLTNHLLAVDSGGLAHMTVTTDGFPLFNKEWHLHDGESKTLPQIKKTVPKTVVIDKKTNAAMIQSLFDEPPRYLLDGRGRRGRDYDRWVAECINLFEKELSINAQPLDRIVAIKMCAEVARKIGGVSK